MKYNTLWGQRLYISGSEPVLGQWNEALACEMTPVGDGHWEVGIDIPDEVNQVRYHYLVRAEQQETIREWSEGHTLILNRSRAVCRVFDSWLNTPADLPFYSSAFTKAIFARPADSPVMDGGEGNLTIQVFAPQVSKGQYIALAGSRECLGDWNPERALRMCPDAFPLWRLTIDASRLTFPFTYKFLLCDGAGSFVWETGEDRVLNDPFRAADEAVVQSGLFFNYADNHPKWKGAGTVIPVFSLRSETSFGVGDLGDLRLLIDWAGLTGQCLIQLLPMNDTRMTHTWLDSYPYSAMSIYALHPMYIDLFRMGELKEEERRNYYGKRQTELNAGEVVDYEKVIETKMAYCREYVAQEGIAVLTAGEGFALFYERNKDWLKPYAAYCYLRDEYGTADFDRWEHDAVYDARRIDRLCSPGSPAYPEVLFNYYLQYVADRQFREATDYARAKGIVLKGDLPIGVNRRSVEVWTEPDYFSLNGQSGAPPDDFSVYGQNWLFPTYRWDVMEQDNYVWWQRRFAKMNDYFDCFRVDHILGFFRIWEIPGDYVQGLCGHFNAALPLSIAEIERAGLRLDEERFLLPRICGSFLPELFGDCVDEVLESYLTRLPCGHYVLNPFCDTQKKIQALFSGKTDDRSVRLRDGLYSIANEVLFLRDPKEADKFHPRISASQSFAYKELSDSERQAYDRLYDDFFYHRHNSFWKEQAMAKLAPLVQSTKMLVCGEDLGMIPATVPEVMHALQLLSLEIERMPKAFGVEFADLTSLPYTSVCTTSTHDMSPIRSWWKEDRAKTQRYYHSVLNRTGEAPDECTSELATQILANHLSSPAMLTVIPWQDWMATDDALKRADADAERINVPARTNHYWRYRMHIALEDLLKADGLNKKIGTLIKQSARCRE